MCSSSILQGWLVKVVTSDPGNRRLHRCVDVQHVPTISKLSICTFAWYHQTKTCYIMIAYYIISGKFAKIIQIKSWMAIVVYCSIETPGDLGIPWDSPFLDHEIPIVSSPPMTRSGFFLRCASAPEPKPPRAPAAAADWGSPSAPDDGTMAPPRMVRWCAKN